MNRIVTSLVAVGALALFEIVILVTSVTTAAPPGQKGDAERGEYVFALAGGCGCHNSDAGFLAGGREYGPFYASNITPDSETGIGDWSDQEIVDAIRLGKAPDGEQLGVMPLEVFSNIADQDAFDLVAYLRTVPTIQNEVPARTVEDVPAFAAEQTPPATAPTGSGVARGDYIVNALAHCGDCHTPPNVAFMAGGAHPEFDFVPNITPDNDTGVGTWTEEEMAEFLRIGTKPDGEQIEPGVMANIIENAFSKWTEEDAQAVAAYLKTVPVAPLEAPATTAAEAPADTTTDTATEAPADTTTEAPADTATDTAADTSAAAPSAQLPATGDTTQRAALLGMGLALLGVLLLLMGFLLRRWSYSGDCDVDTH